MAVQQSSFFCPVCQQQRLFTRQRSVNHILHLLVMVFTCGLWAIVWAVLIFTDNPRFHCSQCGHSDSVKYLANPNLRSQESQLNAERAALRGESSSPSSNPFTEWFSGLSSLTKIFMGVGSAALLILFVVILSDVSKTAKRPSNTQANTNSTSNNSSVTTPINVLREPSSLSPAENLEEAKRLLSTGNDVNKTFASIHLEKIPKTAKEYPEAKKLLAQIKVFFQRANQRNEPNTRKEIEDELANLAGEDAQLDRALDLYEDYEGPAATQTKLKALKRKGEIELRRIELERKLKRMP